MNKLKLLYFGLDYLRLNLVNFRDGTSAIQYYLDSIFDKPHNTTNTNILNEQKWFNTDVKVDFLFTLTNKGEAIQVSHKGIHIFKVTKISDEWATNLMYEYNYMIDFYGQFFSLARLEELDIQIILQSLIENVEDGLTASISRIDICADLGNCTPDEIFEGYNNTKRIQISRINEDENGVETIYVGPKNTKHKIRIYNKILDINAKNKQKYFFDYLSHKNITRLEVEMRSEICRKYQITLQKILDLNFIFSIFKRDLNNKYQSFKIMSFIKQELVKNGYQAIPLDIQNIDAGEMLKSSDYVKRFIKMAKKLQDCYSMNPILILFNDEGILRTEGERLRIKQIIDSVFGREDSNS